MKKTAYIIIIILFIFVSINVITGIFRYFETIGKAARFGNNRVLTEKINTEISTVIFTGVSSLIIGIGLFLFKRNGRASGGVLIFPSIILIINGLSTPHDNLVFLGFVMFIPIILCLSSKNKNSLEK